MTPTTLEALQTQLVAWAAGISGRDVVVDDEGGPPPAASFVALSLRRCTPIEHDRVVVSREAENVRTLYQLRWRVTLFGGAALADASRLRASLWSARRWWDLWALAGLGAVSSLQNLSALETGRLRARAEFQLTLHAVLEWHSPPQYFTHQRIDLFETDLGLIATLKPGDC